MKNKKAVVLAGGVGARLDRLNSPKPLVRVGAESMLVRIVKQLQDAGFSEISIVVGHRGDEIVKELFGRSDITADLTFIEQSEDETAGGLLQSFLALPDIDEVPTVVTMADLVFVKNPFEFLLSTAGDSSLMHTMIGTHPEHRNQSGAQSKAKVDGVKLLRVDREGESYDGVEIGIYYLPKGLSPITEHYKKGKPTDLADLVNQLADLNEVGVVPWDDEYWYDVNTPALHTKANMMIRSLDEVTASPTAQKDRQALKRFSFFSRRRDMVSDIIIERGLVKNIAGYEIIPDAKASSPHYILTDSRVDSFYGEQVLDGFLQAGYAMKKIVVPEGESTKSLDIYSDVADELFSYGIDKNTILFSLGGGVVNNLAGVLASTLYRGIELMHISTSSMSQVDAALDFKQAINSRMGKNLIGSYYPASKILIDPEVLTTLTDRHLRNGIAESLKHGLTQSKEFVDELMDYANKLDDISVLEKIIRRTVELKVPLLRGDVHDDYNEMLPQYGHSVAHAVEHLSAYELYHGEAVTIGVCVSAEISKLLGFCDDATVEAHYELSRQYKLPTAVPKNISADEVVDKIRYDKHYVKGLSHMALPVAVGKMWEHNGVYGVPIEYDILHEAIKINKEKA